MIQCFFIGVDGGATKCIVRVEDEAGRILGQETCGPANIRISVDQAWQSINTALSKILTANSLSLREKKYQFHAGMGLAGCELAEAYQTFLNYPHCFTTLMVSSDAHTACLGAHGGEDGAIIIAGTGVVGFQIQQGSTAKVGGWGFPHDDEGGGAWLGLEAVKLTLQWLDGRLPRSNLAEAVYVYFKRDRDQLVNWANQANSTAFAEMAPIVIQQIEAHDEAAIHLIKRCATAIDRIGYALYAQQPVKHKPLPCSLVGGIAPFLVPYLGEELRQRLRPSLSAPDAGAIFLVRDHLLKRKDT